MMRNMAAAAALVLASCMVSATASDEAYDRARDTKTYRNYTSHSVAFFESLLSGRVWVLESPGDGTYGNVALAMVFAEDGRRLKCSAKKAGGHMFRHESFAGRWSLKWGGHAATILYKPEDGGPPGHVRLFHDPNTGALAGEIRARNKAGEITHWGRPVTGWIQDTMPRSLADACPALAPAAGLGINEKQTSLEMDELRRQDPDAPIRHLPGAEHTAPGRTGLGASELAPTTTREAVFAFMRAQHGNIVLSPKGNPRVLILGDEGGPHELWQLGKDGKVANTSTFHEVKDGDGEWLEGRRRGKSLGRYPMGYPFPYLPTGYRHATFQLTDRLVEAGEPVALPWMPAKWKDFAFLADGKVRARRADGGPDRISTWRWTQGRLWVQIDGNREAPDWEEAYEQLGMAKPKLWTPADGQRATRGAGKCVGDHEGTATWTLGADGKRVWDTSGCRKRTE